MDIHALKSSLQAHLGDGLVTIVGSGLSCAEGLPGMGAISNHLEACIPSRVASGEDAASWKKIVSDIKAVGLEAALLKTQPTPTLETTIMGAVSELLLPTEQKILSETVLGKRTLRFTRLVKHLLKPTDGLPVITTNYDRLIEFATEQADIGVDTMFIGNYSGGLNEPESRASFLRDVNLKGKLVRYRYRQRIRLYKPHGSFDWYHGPQGPLRFGGELSAPRLIITPGLNKFRNGYESPFDAHRERANAAIDRASRYLIIGYGFNDDHLETHLRPMIKSGKPVLLVTHELSKAAKDLVKSNAKFTALQFGAHGAKKGTIVSVGPNEQFIPDLHIWDLDSFITEVLEP